MELLSAAPIEFKYGTTIEGMPIKRASHVSRTKWYRRWYVHCPLALGKHSVDCGDQCNTYRNVGARQLEEFGIAGVYAYLGVLGSQSRFI